MTIEKGVQPAPHVFKAYDIRGVVGKDISADFAWHLALAFGRKVMAAGEDAVVVGYDGRLSSPQLAAALAEGFSALGLKVFEIGQVPTPLTYFACTSLAKSGIQVTGSHNPPDYNGFKMVLSGVSIHGETIQELRRMMATTPTTEGRGPRQHRDLWPQYLATVQSFVTLERPLKVVVDAGNGIAGAFAPALLRALGCEVVELFCDVDGRFPNHHPDPANPHNLIDLIAAVKTHKAELGLAFDGDGDRLGVVTRHGENIYPDRQLILFARDILSRHPGATIVFDVKCTRLLGLEIANLGGVGVMSATGHSLVKARVREVGALLAGEMSGHIFFSERWFGFDDALYTAARLLEVLCRYPDPSATLSALPQAAVTTPELTFTTAEGENHRLIATLLKEGVFEGCRERITIDGLRLEYDDGFGLVRASNTTPSVVLRFEADSAAALIRIQAAFREQIQRFMPTAALPF